MYTEINECSRVQYVRMCDSVTASVRVIIAACACVRAFAYEYSVCVCVHACVRVCVRARVYPDPCCRSLSLRSERFWSVIGYG